jgi:hypothetical protein
MCCGPKGRRAAGEQDVAAGLTATADSEGVAVGVADSVGVALADEGVGVDDSDSLDDGVVRAEPWSRPLPVESSPSPPVPSSTPCPTITATRATTATGMATARLTGSTLPERTPS